MNVLIVFTIVNWLSSLNSDEPLKHLCAMGCLLMCSLALKTNEYTISLRAYLQFEAALGIPINARKSTQLVSCFDLFCMLIEMK